jgi:hypothetical protein
LVDSKMMGQVDMRLRHLTGKDIMCGGIPLLLVGDHHQLPPIQATPWYRSLVEDANPGGAAASLPDSASQIGLRVLESSGSVTLTRLMRAEGDDDFIDAQKRMRRTAVAQPIDQALLDRLRPLSAADVSADEEWLFAPLAVLTQLERDHCNVEQAKAFARTFGLPLFKWKLPIAGKDVDEKLHAGLYEEEPTLWHWYVRGAPVLLTENVKSTRGLVNGTPGVLDSLTFKGEGTDAAGDDPLRVAQLERARDAERQSEQPDGYVGEAIEVPRPTAVHIRVGGGKWHGVDMDVTADDIGEPGEPVVPLLVHKNQQKVVLRGAYAAIEGAPEEATVKMHAFMFASGLERSGVQGGRADPLGRLLRTRL